MHMELVSATRVSDIDFLYVEIIVMLSSRIWYPMLLSLCLVENAAGEREIE
jgi:hypothetical protein